MTDNARAFLVARNPDTDSKLPYLLLLPLEDGLALKARETWPATARVYCHRFQGGWPTEAEIIEQTPVWLCRRRGAAIDLLLDRPRLARSQFVFTQVKGREAIFWQTQKTARSANHARGDPARGGRAQEPGEPRRHTLRRNACLPDATPRRAPPRREAGYAALYKLEHVNGNWLADQLARLEVRYPEVHLVFADSRRLAEEWTYRFLSTALADMSDPSPNG